MKQMIMKKVDSWADSKSQKEFDDIMTWVIGIPFSAILMAVLSIQF